MKLLKRIALALAAMALVGMSQPLAAAVPVPGVYSGYVSVSQYSQPDLLSISYVLRVTARVSADGTIVILSASGNPPNAAPNVEASITRIMLGENGQYFVNGTNPVTLNAYGPRIKISYQDPPTITTVSANPQEPLLIDIPDQSAGFEFFLRRKRP